MNTKRPVPLTIASILLALLSLGNLSLPLFHPPLEVTFVGIVLGILGLVAAFGLWRRKRWGMILTIIVSMLNALAAASGIVGAPNVLIKLQSTVGVVVSIVILVLVVLPSARKAYAAERARVTA